MTFCRTDPPVPNASDRARPVEERLGRVPVFHRLLQVLVEDGEELVRRQPRLIRADERREVARHLAGFDGLDTETRGDIDIGTLYK